MIEQAAADTVPAGEIVAVGVSFQDYLQQFDASHHEWVRGYVIKMSPISMRHFNLVIYLIMLFKAYCKRNPIGVAVGDPFAMRLETSDSWRQPDVQIILNTNPGQLADTAMIGPADIGIEVVSLGSVASAYGDKFVEYERSGVGEYWIFDPMRTAAYFHRLGSDGLYALQSIDTGGFYRTPKLPRFGLHVPTF